MLFIAVIPAIALMIFIYLQDNIEREPLGLLLGIFGLGILSVIPTMICEYISEKIIDVTFGGAELLRLAVSAFFGVGIIEEGFKFLAAYLPTWRNRHFNYKFDGIVYCLFGSMGFAAIENILYLFRQYTEDITKVLGMGLQRGAFAIPAHAMCAIFMGYYYGNAKYAKSNGDRAACRKYLIHGYLIASSLHAFYDFCLFTENGFFVLLFYIFVAVADIFTIIRIVKAKKENQKMYVAPELSGYWVGPAADPYRPYGGYQAPAYGGYSFQTPQPQMGQPQFQPQMGQTQFQPQGGQAPMQPAPMEPMQPVQPMQPIGQMPNLQQPSGQAPIPQGGQAYQQQVQQPIPQSPARQMDQPPYQQPSGQVPQQPDAPMIPPTSFRNTMVYCPVCSAINNFNAFNCTACGAALHKWPEMR